MLRTQVKLPPAYDVTGNIIAYEEGKLDNEDILTLFVHLLNSGLAWKLQGHYGRAAKGLVESGYIVRHPSGIFARSDKEA
jgi:hypothetical protein